MSDMIYLVVMTNSYGEESEILCFYDNGEDADREAQSRNKWMERCEDEDDKWHHYVKPVSRGSI